MPPQPHAPRFRRPRRRPRPVPPRRHAAADDPGAARVGAARRGQPQGRPDRPAHLPALLGTLVFVVLLGLVWHGFIYFLVSNTFMLGVLRLLLLRARGRLGTALLRRLASRPAARAAAEAAARGGRAQRRALPSRSPARCCSPRTWWRCSATSSPRCSATGRPPMPPRPLQRAAARRRLGRRPLGAAARQHLRGEHRRRRPAAPILFGLPRNMTELPVRRGLGDGRAVPRRLRREARAQQPGHLGRRQQGAVQGRRQPRGRGDDRGRRGHHRAGDQLLRDGQPAGLPQPGAGGRRPEAQRP